MEEEEKAHPDIYKYYKNYGDVNDPFIAKILTNPADLDTYKKKYKRKYFKTTEKYFILIGEENFWQNKMNSDRFKDSLAIEKMYYSYDTYRIVSMLKEYLTRLGYTQTFIHDKPGIDLVYFNNTFTNNLYYKTPAKIKNALLETSTANIMNKDDLYINMVKVHGIKKTLDCFAASIVVYSTDSLEDKIMKTSQWYLKEQILDKYDGTHDVKYDDAITVAEHYIVRPVQFIADPRFSAGCGGGIIILNFGKDVSPETIQQSQKNILKLLEKYKSVIISKFINTRAINGTLFNLRTTVFASITKLDGKPHYNLRSYLCHFMDIMSSDTNLLEGQSQSNITNYNSMNTHSTSANFKIYPIDLLKLGIIVDAEVAEYKRQMIIIIKKVMDIFKLKCQIYPETENGFMELGFDFMIGANHKVYLAEINTDLGFFDFRDSNDLITSLYSLYNNNIMNTVIRGIIEPVLVTNKYIHNLPEYDGFTEIIITENLDDDPGREGLPIKEQIYTTPTYRPSYIRQTSNRTLRNWRKDPSQNNPSQKIEHIDVLTEEKH